MSKFSIIVPCYNVEKYLNQCVESLCGQTLEDIEIILVDDGSPDNSGKICDEWANKDSRITVIHKPNGGVSAARNDGLKIAKGEYVLFCDSDDWMALDALEKLYTAGVSENADVVIGDYYQVYSNKTILASFHNKQFCTSDKVFIKDLIRYNFSRKYCPLPNRKIPSFGYGSPWNKAVRRDLLLKENIQFDVTVKGIYDDLLYSAYVLATASKVCYIKSPIYYYRILQTSITRTYKANLLEINQAIFHAWEVFLERYDIEKTLTEAYYANVIRRLKALLGLYFFSPKNPKSLSLQFAEIKGLLAKSPYREAILGAKREKLFNSFDQLVWFSGKKNSPIGMYISYWLYVLMKKVI